MGATWPSRALASGLQAYQTVAEMPYREAIDYFTLLRGLAYQSEGFRARVAALPQARGSKGVEG